MMKVLEEQKVLLSEYEKVLRLHFQSSDFVSRLDNLTVRKDRINTELKESADEMRDMSDSLIKLITNNEVLINAMRNVDHNGIAHGLMEKGELELTIQESSQFTTRLEERGRLKLRKYETQQKELVKKSIMMNRVFTGVGLSLLAFMFYLIQRDFNRGKSEQLKLRRSNIRLINEVSRKSQELEEVIEKIHEGYFIFSKNGICTYCNTQGAAMLSMAHDRVQGTTFMALFADWFDEKFNAELLQSIRSGGSISYELKVPLIHKYFIFSIYGTSEGHVIIFRDITEIRKVQEEIYRSNEKLTMLNEQLRDLSVYLQRVREDERDYISKEIHDHFGQLLTSLKLDLAWMENNVSTDLKPRVKEAIELLNEAIQSVRRISADLRPAILDDFGFLAALEWHIKNFKQKTGIETTLEVGEGNFDFERELSTALFRIVQESMTNVFRHARATKVKITLEVIGEIFQMTIEDNGVGMAQDKKSGGIGLIGMKERAHAMGGQLEIIAAAEQGTTLIFTLELNDEMYRHG